MPGETACGNTHFRDLFFAGLPHPVNITQAATAAAASASSDAIGVPFTPAAHNARHRSTASVEFASSTSSSSSSASSDSAVGSGKTASLSLRVDFDVDTESGAFDSIMTPHRKQAVCLPYFFFHLKIYVLLGALLWFQIYVALPLQF